MKKIFMTMLATLLASNLFADGELFNVCFGSEPAIQGKLYSYYANGGILNVLQVLKNGILVKKNDMFEGSIFLQEKIIFIKMNTRGLSDGSQVPVGQYRCTGTVTYEAVLGASRTVPAFAELSAAEKEQIYQEEKRAEKERKEKEIRDQPERKKMAEAIIGGIDLNMGCIRIEKSIAPSFEISVKHFMWNRLVECKASGDWLGFLNAADDIVSNRMEPASRLELFPDANQVRKLCDALKKFRFVCEVRPQGVLLCLIPNWKWKQFIASCKTSDAKADGIPRMRSDTCFSHVPYVPEVVLSKVDLKYGLPVLGDEPILVGGSGLIGKYNRSEYMERIENLIRQAENREIPLSSYKTKVLAMNSEAWRKINEELIPVPRGAELERVRKEVAGQKSAELAKAKEQFVNRVSGISFCLGDHIIVQQDLLPHVHSVKVDEGLLRLQRLQQEQSWDEMAKFLTSVEAVSTPDVYSKAWVALAKRQFPVDIYFTKNTRYYQRKSEGDWWSHSFADSGIIDMKISVVEKTKMCVYASVNYGDPLQPKMSNPTFDIMSWLKTQKFDKMRPDIRNMELATIPRQGPRDISQLVKHKDDELNAAKADLSRFRRAVASVKWPPEYLVVTNVSVVGGKMVYNEKKKTFKIPQKVRGLALLLDNSDVVELYGKYCGGLELARFKEEWKKAGEKQESVYKKYKSAFDSIEKAIMKTVDKACPKK